MKTKLKSKTASILLACMLIIGLLPATALAVEPKADTDVFTVTGGQSGTDYTYSEPPAQARTVSSGDAVPVTVSDGNGKGRSGSVYEFHAAELTAAADGEKIAAGTGFASYYIITFGELTKRTSEEGRVKSVEVGESAGSGFSFTVSGQGAVSFTASSTDDSNTSRVGILNSRNELVADQNGKTYTDITGTSPQEVTYTLSAGTYRIVSPESEYNRGAWIYTISITDSPVLPPGDTLTGSIKVSDGANLLGDTNRVRLVPENGQAITLEKGDNTVSLNPSTKYNISLTTPNEKIRALSEGKDFIQTGVENISTEITVSPAVVKPLVTLSGDLSLAQGASLMLSRKGVGNPEKLTVGNQVELIIGQTYEVSTDMADTQVYVDGKTEFTAWEGMTALEITLVKTKKEVAVTVEDPEGLLGSTKVQLENIKDASEVHTLQNGTSVKLNRDAIYQLSCTTSDVEASVNGSKLVQVTEDLDSITVKISKKDENYHEIDLSQGLKAGTAYEGGISVLEDMTYEADVQNIGGSLYLGYVAGANNPKTNSSSAQGTVPDSGSVLLLTAQKDGTLRVAVKINAGETVYLVSTTDEVQRYTNTGDSPEFKLMNYQVQAGDSYYFYGDGPIPMYGITVDYREVPDVSGSIEETEAAIEALPDTVNPDDTKAEEQINAAKDLYDALSDYEKSLISADAKDKLEGLLAALRDYRITEGSGSSFTKGSSAGLTFTANGAYSKFTGIEVDDKTVDADCNTAENGSTVITLKAEYLETLAVGKHTLTVLYTDGEATGTFTVAEKPAEVVDDDTESPQTGDDSNIVLWIALMLAACMALSGTVLYNGKNKKKYSR